MENFPNFKDRKFLTLINANKYSYVKGELYSLRRKAILFFEEKCPKRFDLYGRGRDIKPYTKIIGMLRMYFLESIKSGQLLKFLFEFFCIIFY